MPLPSEQTLGRAPSTTTTPATVIVNPAAGGGRAGRRAPDAVRRLEARGLRVDVIETRGRADATRIARERFEAGVRQFIGVGGDGTMHEIVDGVMSAEAKGERARVACLPLGTGNSFLRDFGVRDADTAFERLVAGHTHDVDVVRVHHRDGVVHSLNLVSVGFSADANTKANRKYKRFGTFGYVLGVLETTLGLGATAFPFSTDRAPLDRRPALLLSFSNSRCTGGAMQIAPAARVDDGEVDIIRIAPMSRTTLLGAFPTLFRGTHVQRSDVESSRARRVEFELGDRVVDCIVDGEVYPLSLRSLEVLPAAIQVIA